MLRALVRSISIASCVVDCLTSMECIPTVNDESIVFWLPEDELLELVELLDELLELVEPLVLLEVLELLELLEPFELPELLEPLELVEPLEPLELLLEFTPPGLSEESEDPPDPQAVKNTAIRTTNIDVKYFILLILFTILLILRNYLLRKICSGRRATHTHSSIRF